MRLSIILLLLNLRCQTAYHIQFHPFNSSTTYIPFTLKHHNSASFVTAGQTYGCLSYIPLPYFLIVGRKRPFHYSIHNSFFLMLMLLSGDIHVNPGPINGYSNYLCSPHPTFAAAATPPPPSPPSVANVDSGTPPPTAPFSPTAPPPLHHHPHPHTDSTNNKFKLCTLNIQSLRHQTHAAVALSPHPPELFSLIETFLNSDITLAEYQDYIASGYNLYRTPRTIKSRTSKNTTKIKNL